MPPPDVVIHPHAAEPLPAIRKRLAPVARSVLEHDVYTKLTSLRALRVFVEHHCFAVWDFMSLLKTLQRRLTCVEVPWMPPANREGARLVNEIVVAEESDCLASGDAHASHFELYLDAMREVRADTSTVEAFLDALATGATWQLALAGTPVHASVRQFVARTLALCDRGEIWEVAADFVLGRENLIPDMFREVSAALAAGEGLPTESLTYYLDRHVELDEQEHGPAGAKLLFSLCGEAAERWAAVERGARQALLARAALWDGVVVCIEDLDA